MRAASMGVREGSAMNARFWASVLGLGLVLAGCTSIVEEDRKQCTVTADCAGLFGTDAPYVCEANFCVRPTCTSDTTCTDLGFANSVCSGDGRCSAGCTADDQCGSGNVCVLATRRCKTRECTTNDECKARLSNSSTAVCNAGTCEDPVWGCIGERDNRPAATLPTATLHIPFVKANLDGTREPVLGTRVIPCPDPAVSVGVPCETESQGLTGITTSQDPTTGLITLRGIRQGTFLRVRLIPPVTEENLSPVDYYTQMTIRDEMTVPMVVTIRDAYLRAAGPSYNPPVQIRADLGGMWGVVFDCQGNPAAGATVEIGAGYSRNGQDTTPISPTVVTYFSNGVPSPYVATATDGSGLFSIINTETSFVTPLSVYAPHGRKASSMQIKFAPSCITTVHFHPREYPLLGR